MTSLVRRPQAIVAAVVTALALSLVPALPAFAAGPGTATLTLTQEGQPVLFSGLTLNGPDGFVFGSTNELGIVELTDLALGAYTGETFGGFEDRPSPVSFTLTETEPDYVGVVEITAWPNGTGSIGGTITNAATGLPLEGVTLGMIQHFVPAGRSFPSQYTPASGTFGWSELSAGSYSLSAYLPGYFNVWNEIVELGDGEDAALNIAMIAKDAGISGRVLDDAGVGVEGVMVSAQSGVEGNFATTDADGLYTITDLGLGSWSVGFGGSGWPWERTSVVVALNAGETAIAPDLVATPRTSGTLSGVVAGSDQEPGWEGLADICVHVVEPDGDPVGAAETTTESGYFSFDSITPGDYSVRFEDCDATRTPPYATTYLGGSPTIAGATIVTVATQAETWVDYTSLDRAIPAPEPTHDPNPVSRQDLELGDEDLIDAPLALRRGQTVEVAVGTEFAGQWVSAWLHSRPTQLGGWQRVSAEGTIEVAVPTHHPIGFHELVVQDADDDVIGWTELRVLQRLE